MKEAIVKGTILYGVPRAAQGLGPLFRALPEGEIDLFSPRYMCLADSFIVGMTSDFDT